jgi:predicted LPLAT superfamily acyltransferase
LTFAECALDRFFFLRGRYSSFQIEQIGHNHIEELVQKRRGAILLGCHLGSFEALRAASRHHQVPVSIVADFLSAQKLNAILSSIGDNTETRFLDASGDRVSLGLKVREAVDRGELVAILADRAGLGRFVRVPFLGQEAPFPVGPYLLASLAACPLYFTTSLYTAPNRYELICEPFADRVHLPRKEREASLRRYVEAYAKRLEFYARRNPDNWFNFFPFWDER